MAGTNQGIIEPPIDSLLEKVDSKYQLVIYAAKRARRLRTAKTELASQGEFDFRVVNDDVARAAAEVARLTR